MRWTTSCPWHRAGPTNRPTCSGSRSQRTGRRTGGSLIEAHFKEMAQALFPRVEVTLKTADALLILEAGSILL